MLVIREDPDQKQSDLGLHCLSKPFGRQVVLKGALAWYGKCPRLDFDTIMSFNCLGYNFNIYGAFEFLCNSIANL